jgi:hypothetical protein
MNGLGSAFEANWAPPPFGGGFDTGPNGFVARAGLPDLGHGAAPYLHTFTGRPSEARMRPMHGGPYNLDAMPDGPMPIRQGLASVVESEKQLPLTVESACNVILRLVDSSILEPKAELVSRLIQEISIGATRLGGERQQCHFERTEISRFGNIGSVVNLNGNSPLLQIAAVADVSQEILIVCGGDLVRTFNLATGVQLSSEPLPLTVSKIAVCPDDPSVFAVACLTDVHVLCLKEGGGVEILHKVELMLEARANDSGLLFVISIDWVPHEDLHFAVCISQHVIV